MNDKKKKKKKKLKQFHVELAIRITLLDVVFSHFLQQTHTISKPTQPATTTTVTLKLTI